MCSPFIRKAGWLFNVFVLAIFLLSAVFGSVPLAVKAQDEGSAIFTETPTPPEMAAQTETLTPTETQSPVETLIPTQTLAPVETRMPTETPTLAETPLQTQAPTSTETLTQTETLIATKTVLPTETPTLADTLIQTETPTSTATLLSSETPTSTATPQTEINAQYTVDGVFQFPLDSYSIIQTFGNFNNYTQEYHLGEDATASAGTPVYAAGNGNVKRLYTGTTCGDYGHAIVIEHQLPPGDPSGSYVYTIYGHLQDNFQVLEGHDVQRGQLIGYISAEGNANGCWAPHLHFGVHKGQYVQVAGSIAGYGSKDDEGKFWVPTDFINAHKGGAGTCIAPTLTSPGDGFQSTGNTISLSWSHPMNCSNQNGFYVRVGTSSGGSNVLSNYFIPGLNGNVTVGSQWFNQDLYWSVQANATGASWSNSRRFRISPNVSTPTVQPTLPPTGWNETFYSDNNLGSQCGSSQNDTSIYMFKDSDGGWSPPSGCPSVSSAWSVRMENTSVPFTGGSYSFGLFYDDGARLYIDDQLRVDGWSASQHYESQSVSSGNHKLRLEYKNNAGHAIVQLWWRGPGALPGIGENQDPYQWWANYWGNQTQWQDSVGNQNEGSGFLNHDWGNGSPGFGLPVDHFSSRFERTVYFDCGTYAFHLKSDDGSRFWLDGNIEMDYWQTNTYDNTLNISLSAGNHQLKVDQFENGGGAHIYLDWTPLSYCPVPNPVPQISLSTPSSINAGSGDFILNITGANFLPTSAIYWNSQLLTTQYIDNSLLSTVVPASYISSPGSANIYVSNPSPGGGNSNILTFSIIVPPPAPSANFDAFPQTGNAPLTSSMHIVNIANISNCSWDYGDGQTSTTCTQLHDHIYNNPGSYTISLTVTGPGGSDSMTRGNYIVVTTNATYALTISKNGTGGGTVTSNPTGITCGSDCTETYAYNTNVTLTATPATGSSFGGWSGACTGLGNCVVAMTAAKSVTATFNVNSYTLTVNSGLKTGMVTSNPTGIDCGLDCTEKYVYNTSVTLTAISQNGFSFTGWSGACTGIGNCVVIMTADKSVTTTFSKITYALTVSKTGAGSGTITSNPASIDCGLTCSSNFDYNSAVTLTANPSNGSTFTGWSGAGCSGTGTCTVTMTAATSVTANFKLDCFTLTKLANPVAGGTVNASPAPNCNNGTQYSYDTVVSLTASPKTGYSFTDWSDALSGSNNPTSVTMEGDNTVTANFTDIQSPILNWSSPVGNGQVYNAGNQSIQLEVNASDNVGVSYVHFYRWDSVNLIPVDIENVYNSPYSISFDTGGLNPGWNEIDADAVDAAGNGAHNYIWINHLIPPSPFSKINPANYDTGIATNPTLSWETSNGATAYEYCYDTTDDNTCTSWHSTGTNTSVALGSLITGTTYYWQVRATNQGGATYANDDTWWSFTAQDKISPTEGSTPLTTRPTLDWEDTPGATSYTLQVSTSANFGSFIVNKTVSPSSYTLTTDLARSKWIYWRIYPKGVSPTAWSGVHKFLSASPPSVPTLSFPSDGSLVGNDTPRLDWTNSSLPSGTTFNYYQLQIATDTKFNSLVQDITINDLSISELPFTTLLNPNSKYYWRVCAFNTDGQYSLWSSTRSFRTRLPAPSLLTVIPLTTRPTFSWQAVDGATGYAIQVSTSYTYSSPILNTSTTGPTYTPTSDLPRNKTLYWRVYAKGTNPSNWEPNGFISFFSANPPSVPTLLAPSDGVTLPNYAPTLDWNDPVLADHYEVQIASASTFSEGTIVIDTSTTSISNYVPSPALAANSTFYWRVRVYDLQGQYSNWSSVRHFNTTLPAPSLISPANLATGVPLRPIFDWGDESGATSYVIQVSTSPSFTSLTINKTVTGSSYTSTSNLYLDKKYYWRVYAKGTYNSPWSGVWSFDTYINNTLFSDDFSGDLSKWSIFNGTWVIENGELSGTGHGMTEPKDGYIYAGDTAWNNYTLSAKVLSGESDFILRSTGHWQNEYRITLWPVGSSYPNTYQINKYQNGAGINLLGTERLTFPISVTGPYLVEVEVINNHIRLSINGTLVNDIVDPNPLSAGRFGLGVIWSTQNDFDDVKVVASN